MKARKALNVLLAKSFTHVGNINLSNKLRNLRIWDRTYCQWVRNMTSNTLVIVALMSTYGYIHIYICTYTLTCICIYMTLPLLRGI